MNPPNRIRDKTNKPIACQYVTVLTATTATSTLFQSQYTTNEKTSKATRMNRRKKPNRFRPKEFLIVLEVIEFVVQGFEPLPQVLNGVAFSGNNGFQVFAGLCGNFL